jgi:photosystem II stability/assembly factor-like uncharacterized protein
MPENNLEALYAEARQALKAKNYERATDLLKQILVSDENYKDASRLLAQLVKEKRRRWYNDLRFWGLVFGIVIVGLLIWIVPKLPLQRMFTSPPGTVSPMETTPLAQAASPTIQPTQTTPPTATALPSPTSIPLTWQRISVGEKFSRDTVTAIAVDPKDPDVIFVGTQNSGIYKSIDGGLSWKPAQSGLGSGEVGSLVIDPENPNILFAGLLRGTLYKTSDGGANWELSEKISTSRLTLKTFLVMDPDNNQHIYFTLFDTIYHSTNGGDSWTILYFTQGDILDFVINSTDSKELLAVTRKAVHKSKDGGTTWTAMDSAPKKSPDFYPWINPSNTSVFYIPYIFNPNRSVTRLARSPDSGTTWFDVKDLGEWPVKQGPYTMGFSLSDSSIGYFGDGVHLFKTKDTGLTWQKIYEFPVNISTIMLSPAYPEALFIGAQGFFLSKNQGTDWQKRSDGLGAARIELMINSNSSAFYVIEKGIDYESFWGEVVEVDVISRIFRSLDKGLSWETFVDQRGCALSFGPGRMLYYSQQFRDGSSVTVLWMNDAGVTGFFDLPFTSGCSYVIPSPEEPNTLYLLNHHGHNHPLRISHNAGKSWQDVKGSSTNNKRLYFGQQQSGIIYATAEKDVTYSTDGGESWEVCGYFGFDQPIANSESGIAISPKDGKTLYVGFRGRGILFSGDGCQSWQTRNTGLGNLFINSLAIDPQKPETVYAGTDGGAYISTDGGQTWGQINDGLLGATVVYSIVVDKDSNVYAATPYGIFKLRER